MKLGEAFAGTFKTKKEAQMVKRAVMVLGVVVTLAWVAAVLAQAPAGPPQPGPEEKRLGYFVGKWREEVDMKPSALGPGHKGTIIATCEWFSGGLHVVCHGDYSGTAGEVKDLGLFSYSREDKVYVYYEVISDGDRVFFTDTVQGNTWTWASDTKISGKIIKGRFMYREASADMATMKYEIQGDDGKWNSVMEAKASRVK